MSVLQTSDNYNVHNITALTNRPFRCRSFRASSPTCFSEIYELMKFFASSTKLRKLSNSLNNFTLIKNIRNTISKVLRMKNLITYHLYLSII